MPLSHSLPLSVPGEADSHRQHIHPCPHRMKSILAPQFRPASMVLLHNLRHAVNSNRLIWRAKLPSEGKRGAVLEQGSGGSAGLVGCSREFKLCTVSFPPSLLSLQTNAPSVLIAPPLFMLIKSSDTEPRAPFTASRLADTQTKAVTSVGHREN